MIEIPEVEVCERLGGMAWQAPSCMRNTGWWVGLELCGEEDGISVVAVRNAGAYCSRRVVGTDRCGLLSSVCLLYLDFGKESRVEVQPCLLCTGNAKRWVRRLRQG